MGRAAGYCVGWDSSIYYLNLINVKFAIPYIHKIKFFSQTQTIKLFKAGTQDKND